MFSARSIIVHVGSAANSLAAAAAAAAAASVMPLRTACVGTQPMRISSTANRQIKDKAIRRNAPEAPAERGKGCGAVLANKTALRRCLVSPRRRRYVVCYTVEVYNLSRSETLQGQKWTLWARWRGNALNSKQYSKLRKLIISTASNSNTHIRNALTYAIDCNCLQL